MAQFQLFYSNHAPNTPISKRTICNIVLFSKYEDKQYLLFVFITININIELWIKLHRKSFLILGQIIFQCKFLFLCLLLY